MARKMNFWKARIGKSQQSRHGWQKRSYARPVMSVERLEDRYMLSANPVLSIAPNQFFGQNTNEFVSDYEVPFRATFTDVLDQDDVGMSQQFYHATVNWGDGSLPEESGEFNPNTNQIGVGIASRQLSDPFGDPAVGDQILGRVEGRHNYADVGQYTVTVTLTDTNGGAALTQSTVVDVYPVDNGLSISAVDVVPDFNAYGRLAGNISEQTPYTFSLDGSSGINQGITSWRVSWGDSIETFAGDPSSAVHAFDDFHDFTYPGGDDGGLHPVSHVIVSAAVTGESGTYVVHSIEYDIADALPIASVVPDSTDINAGEPYTLNFSYIDATAPIQYWAVFWGDGSPLEKLSGDTTSANHIYPNVEANYTITVIPFNTDYEIVVGFAPESHVNVAPTADFTGGGTVNEGTPATVAFSNQFDPGSDDTTAGFHYAYDFDNDGIFEVGNGTYAGSVTSASQAVPTSDGDATYNVRGRIIDKDGGFTDYMTAIVVLNVAPTASLSGGGTVNEGTPATVTFSSPIDPGSADTTAGFRYAYDFDNDGIFEVGNGTYAGSVTSASQAVPTSDDGATYNVRGRIIDKDGGYTDYTTQIVVVNVAPTLTISGAPSVNEGSSYTLNLSSFDPGTDTISSWTINWGDTTTQVVSGNPGSVTHTYADGSATRTIIAKATDEDGTFNANTLLVTVNNVAPTVSTGGPYSTFDDAPITLTGSATDPAGAADPLSFLWDLDNDNIFGESGAGATRGNEVGASVIYNPTGLPTSTQTVKLKVNDGDGGVTISTGSVSILGTGTLLIGGVLYVVGGNTTNDIVLITQSGNTISVCATFNSNNPQTFNAASITDIQVRMRGGNDIVLTTSNVMETMTIDGGTGNDLLTGGGARSVITGGTGNDILYGAAGNDILLGGDGNDDIFGGDGNDILVGGNGNDILDGGSGRDVLIGSQDEDCLSGGNDEDILIGGYTVHDNNVAALDAIMAIWSSSASFSSRVATLSGSGGMLQAGVKVFDDDDHDQLVGDAGRDLYFGDNNPADHVTDSIAVQALQDQLIAVT